MARTTNKQRIELGQLWQGVSSQPPWKKYPGQLDDALNAQLDVLEGARNRNATELLGSSSAFTTGDEAGVRVIPFRDKFIHVGDGSVRAFDSDNTELTVTDNAGDSFAYLSGIDPQTELDWTFAVDTGVFVNRTTTVQSEATESYIVAETVNVFSDLASLAVVPGDKVKVLLSENLDPAGYYEKLSDGSFTRIAAPSDPDGAFTLTTVPHRLIYNESSNSFTWDQLPLNNRRSGSTTTNLKPRFVGSTITSAQFHSGRLFFVCETAVEASRASDIFTWFVNDVEDVTESDRISVDILNGDVGDPLYASSLGTDLFILCESGVLAFSSGDVPLDSKNGRVRYLDDFKPRDLRPASNGTQVVFVDQFNDVHVYAWQGIVSGIQYAGSPNVHAQRFFRDRTIRDIYVVESTTFLVATDWTVYVHDLHVEGGQVVQSAWSRYEFYNEGGNGGRTVCIAPWADKVRLVQSADRWRLLNYVHRTPLTPSGFRWSPRLDQRELVGPGVYDEELDRTRFAHSGADASLTYSELHTPDGEVLRPAAIEKRNCWFEGKIEDACYLGFWYEFRLDLSALYAGASDVRVKLRNLNVFHYLTTNYEVLAGRNENSLKELSWQGVATAVDSVGGTTVDTGHSRHSLTGDARNTFIRIRSQSGGPVTISAFEYGVQTRGG